MSKLTREEKALLKEIKAYQRMNKIKAANQEVADRVEQSHWEGKSPAFIVRFDNLIGVSGLQLDE